MQFDVNAPAPPEAVHALRAEPAFPAAVRASAAGITALYHGSHLLNWLMDDRGRVVVGYLALGLHYAGELTPTRVKALCAEAGVCSPGRAGVMLNLMRFGGYLAPAPAEDKRLRSLVATDKLVGLMMDRWRLHFGAMAPFMPEARAALARLDEPTFVKALTLAMLARFRSGFRLVMHAPEMGLFGDRNAGILIVSSLISAGEADDGVPPSRPVAISVSALARRFAVSRTHVLTLLRDAAADGFIERTGANGEQVRILPRLADATLDVFATLYLYLADCAREALTGTDRERAA